MSDPQYCSFCRHDQHGQCLMASLPHCDCGCSESVEEALHLFEKVAQDPNTPVPPGMQRLQEAVLKASDAQYLDYVSQYPSPSIYESVEIEHRPQDED